MPNMRDVPRGWTRALQVQGSTQDVQDNEAVRTPVSRRTTRATCMPMSAQKIAIKPEGQRTWKWWTATSQDEYQLGWLLFDQKDRRTFEVIEKYDLSQTRIFNYELAETPR